MSDAAARGKTQVGFHVVRSGESLSRIAGDHGVGLHDVITANPQIANPALIRPGQRVNLPKGAHAHTGRPGHAPAAQPPAHPAKPSPARDARPAAAPNAPSIAPGVSAHGFDFIYREEHVDGISERLHWPKGSSGVTIGSGYDMRYRTADQIVRDLTAIGVSGADARAAAGGAGLSGQDAGDFAHRNHDAIVLTDAQERRLLAKAIGPAVETINQGVTVPLTQNQRDALTSLIFNIGGPGFRGSEVRRRLNQQDYAGAAQAFHMWNKSGGKVSSVLVARRQREVALFNRTPVASSVRSSPATPITPSRRGVPLQHRTTQPGGASGGGRFADIITRNGSADAKAALDRGDLVIVGLRSPTAFDINRGAGSYDDTMAIVRKVQGAVDSATFRCNTEPSSQYINHKDPTKRPPDANRDGRPDLGALMTGQTIRYTKGVFLKAEALKIDQTRSYRVGRDTDHDGKLTARDPSSMVPAAGGMHIHIGGAANTWSAGCQTLPPGEHARFFATLRKWAPRQQNFLYVLVDAN
jgi:hypothetical protein